MNKFSCTGLLFQLLQLFLCAYFIIVPPTFSYLKTGIIKSALFTWTEYCVQVCHYTNKSTNKSGSWCITKTHTWGKWCSVNQLEDSAFENLMFWRKDEAGGWMETGVWSQEWGTQRRSESGVICQERLCDPRLGTVCDSPEGWSREKTPRWHTVTQPLWWLFMCWREFWFSCQSATCWNKLGRWRREKKATTVLIHAFSSLYLIN